MEKENVFSFLPLTVVSTQGIVLGTNWQLQVAKLQVSYPYTDYLPGTTSEIPRLQAGQH